MREFLEGKNEPTYETIESAFSNQPDAASELKHKADEIKVKSDELVEYIENLKQEFVKSVDSRPEANVNKFRNMDNILISFEFSIA